MIDTPLRCPPSVLGLTSIVPQVPIYWYTLVVHTILIYLLIVELNDAMDSETSSSTMPAASPDNPSFNKQKHIKYFLRCLKTYLPQAYTSTDSQRVTLAFFILSALDLLGALYTHTTPTERDEYASWILRCQHPGGGFRGFTGTMTGKQDGSHEWDVANLAATYFALAAFAVLGQGMGKVRRRACLEWVRSLQRSNGSFGEGLGKGGKIEGAEDMRFCQLAAGVRWFLRRGDMNEVDDIDTEALVEWIESSVVSGYSASSTSCGVKILTYLDS